jgi:hypothetical protein
MMAGAEICKSCQSRENSQPSVIPTEDGIVCQCRPFGAISLSTNPTEEKTNGQGSAEKQSRKEKTKTGEGKTFGKRIAVFCHAGEAGGHFFIGQETIAPVAGA